MITSAPPERLQFSRRILESRVPAQRQAAGDLDVMQQYLTLPVPQFDLHRVEVGTNLVSLNAATILLLGGSSSSDTSCHQTCSMPSYLRKHTLCVLKIVINTCMHPIAVKKYVLKMHLFSTHSHK